MLKRLLFFVIAASVIGVGGALYAQMPSHTRLLYQDDLQSQGIKDIGTVTNRQGTFLTGEGWQAKRTDSQLKFDLKEYLPFEGTLEVTIKGLMPSVTDDWVPISLWSRPSGKFYDVDGSAGSYAFIKTSETQVEGSQWYWTFWSCPFYGGALAGENNFSKTYPVAKQTYSTSQEYTFKIVWGMDKSQNKMRIWLLLNGVEKASHDFITVRPSRNKAQMESFAHIFLGCDNSYSAMTGPIYKNLKIWVPESTVRFLNVSKSSGTAADTTYGGQGVSWADADGDNLQDLYLVNSVSGAKNLFYKQGSSGTFAESGTAWGISGGTPSMSGLFADFDNDGDLDMFQANLGVANKLYINNGSSVLQDKSSERGISTQSRTTASALALDVNNDGYLDIYAANISAAHELYLNQKNGSFSRTELSSAASPQGTGIRAVAGDIDGDGWTDIFYTRRSGNCVLLMNNHDGTFEDRAGSWNVAVTASTANAPTLFDYDNDGDLDIFVAVGSTSAVHDPQTLVFENQTSQGTQSFVNQTTTVNIPIDAYGIAAGDVDNDRYMDLYCVRSNSRVASAISRLYLNNRNKSFSALDGTGAEVIYADGRGGAFSDYNKDGLLDVYGVAKGDTVAKKYHYGRNYLLKNETTSTNNYLDVAILDDHNKVNGIGAKVKVYKAGQIGQASGLLGYRDISAVQGYQSQESLVQHFGLASETSVDVQVVMPGGKTVSRTNVPATQSGQAYQRYDIKPSAASPTTLELVKGQASQTGTVGMPLADSIIVRVKDVENKPMANHAVSFQITAGGGKLNGGTTNPLSINTDAYGQARVAWTLRTVAGQNNNTLTVSSLKTDGNPLSGSPMTFTASANPGNPSKLVYDSGNGQTGYVLQDLQNPLVVKVTDQYDNIITAGHQVSFDVIDGGGSLGGGTSDPLEVTSGPQGQAQTTWRLGSLVGQQKVRASSTYNGTPLASPVDFTATANPPQLKMVRISSRLQTGTVNQNLGEQFVIKIENLSGVGQQGKTVQFIVSSGGGKFAGSDILSVTTGSDGQASAQATLGTVSGDTNNVFIARTEGAQDSPMYFKATALPGPAVAMQETSGNGRSGIVNRLLPEPFIVRVVDSYNNGIKNHSVGFAITSGGGSINGSIGQVPISTDANGYSAALLRLGTTAGSNTVVASSGSLQGSPVTFTAQGLPSIPAKLEKIAGDNLTGNAGQLLSQPFVVSVADSFTNALEGQNVHFQVTAGNGTINGQPSADISTNASGQAWVTLTLGPTEYLHQVTVTSQYNGNDLENSGLIFTATTGPGDPDSLGYVSGNNQIGKVSSQLGKSFQVKVVDDNGIAVPNHDVLFMAISPGCNFSGLLSKTVKTNSDGIASAYATIGTNYGKDNNVFEARASFNDVVLNGAPITFKASGRKSTARSMVYVSGNNIIGTVGQPFIDTLKVQMLDGEGFPVQGHEVKFERVSGSSFLDVSSVSKNASSNLNGLAAMSITLGTIPEKTIFRAVTDDGYETGFQGSPIQFEVTATIGAPSASVSTITATPDSLAVEGLSNITVTVKDSYGNPISNKTVTLLQEGIPEATLQQPTSSTNSSGQAKGSITSTKAGIVRVWAMVDGNMIPGDKKEIEFSAGAPAKVATFGTGQIAIQGTPLPEPVGVIVQDKYDNYVKNRAVTFAITSGGGSISETQPVYTDTLGKASVHWTLGLTEGWQYLKATVSGFAVVQQFQAWATSPVVGSIEKVSGDSQIVIFNQVLNPLIVLVKDTEGKVISNKKIIFSLAQGSGVFVDSNADTISRTTDTQGRVSVQFRAGGVEMLHLVYGSSNGATPAVFRFWVQKQRTIQLEPSQSLTSARPTQTVLLQVIAKDAWGKKLSSESVRFEVLKGNGAITEGQPRTTNASGVATATWVLGFPDSQKVKLSAPNAPGTTSYYYYALLDNEPPVLNAQKDTTIYPGTWLRFDVSANDPDGDVILSYGVRNLPPGAYFDSTGNHNFAWQPTEAQTGVYPVTFKSTDQYGAIGSRTVIITVAKVNHAPTIGFIVPENLTLSYKYGSEELFWIYAYDADEGSTLTYTWFINDAWYGYNDSLKVRFESWFPETTIIQVIVSDSQLETTVTWTVHVVTSVTLSTFEAEATKNSIQLHWQTAAENNNLGFYVLRSVNKNGSYERLNQTLIPLSANGSYSYSDANVRAGVTYFYKVQDVERSGTISDHGPVSALVALPTELALAQNYPNPFNPATTISFELPAPQSIRLVVYNISGQAIRTLADGNFDAGVHQIIWDARSDLGQPVTTGIYYYRLYAAKEVLTKKLVLVK